MKIKRITVSVLFVLLIIGIFPTATFETKAITTSGIYENLIYHLYDYKEIQIRECMSDAEEIIIPNKINGHPVTSIGNNAFRDCTHIKRIVIPDSVTIIGYGAFGGCTKLTSITIGSGVKTISRSFYGCDNLERVDITNIASWCNIEFSSSFDDSNPLSKAKHLYLNGVEVTDLIIPEDVSIISDIAFLNCESIVGLTLHDNIEIGQNSFSGCSIKKLNFLEGTKTIDSGMVLCKDVLTEINIPNTVMTIESDALSNCTSLESIVVGANNPIYHSSGNCLIETNSKTLILGCKNSVIPIDCSITSIGDYAFYNCTGLTSVIIPDSVTSIGRYAFKSCTGLRSITIGNSVKSIGFGAFNGCTGLTSVIIPDSVTSIGDSAFGGCSSLQEITLPFIGCERYTSTDNKFQYPFGRIFGESKYLGGIKTEQYRYHRNSPSPIFDTYYIPASLKKVTVTGCDYIQYGAFYNCTRLKSITIGNSVKSIGNSAFYNCTGLTSVIIPDSVTSIGDYAFYNCTGPTSVIIPDSVTKIGDSTFAGCTGLKSITIGNSVKSIGNNAFYNCTGLTSIIIPDSVTSIGVYAFKSCTGLTSITIGNSVKSIGDNAFYNCTGLTSIIIPDPVTSIGDSTFASCTGLKSITIGNSVKSIGDCAFYNCTGLTSVIIPDSVTKIGDSTFASCTGLKSITIGNSVKSIGDSAFYGCDYLSTITIPKRVTSIGYNAFGNCCNLKKVCYTGYKSDKAKINIGSSNGCLTDAKWHYLICKNDDHVFSENGNSTCSICGYSKVPSKPILESKTNNSVTLVSTRGFEYSKDGINWQISNTFENLTADKTHTFYQRVKETETVLESEESEALSVKLKKMQSSPSAPLVLSFTDTTVSLLFMDGCEYSIDGINWQASNVFTNLNPGTKYSFYQRYAETDIYEASEQSPEKSITTDKAKQPLIPAAPTVETIGTNIITLNAVENCEYSKDGINWQASHIFDGLSCGTEYSFYQRYKETDTAYAGQSSDACKKKTMKGTQTIPDAPTLLRRTDRSVELTQVSGYEYSKDGMNWQASNVFVGLSPETNYIFYQRKAETATYFASEASASLIVKTLETAFLNSISVTSYPNKLIYIKGEEVIDVTGGKLTLYYSDNTSLIISLTEDMVSGFNKDLVGNQEITVSYSGKTTVFIITVKDKAEKYKPSTPSVPTLISKTANSVTLKNIEGYEYSADGKVWQKSNVFTRLSEGTEYSFYQRIAETEATYASESSAALKVRTDKSYTPGDLDGDEKITDKDAIYLLMHSYFPEDYPVNQPLDYNNDGLINDKDAIYLLMHCYFPEDYPITK